MKPLFFLSIFLFSPLAPSKVIANYTYLKAPKPLKKKISFEEVKRYYEIIKKSSFNPPGPDKMFKDYLRFKLGVEVALHEKSLVKNPNIDKQISNPFLRAAFYEALYSHLAESKLKKKLKRLDKSTEKLTEKTLKKLYQKSPEFNIFWIAIHHPINPSPKQINEARERAKKIHSQVLSSTKPFLELVVLYSDDKANGTLNINRSRASIPPAAFEKLKRMKKGAISAPIRSPYGYLIVKLNRKVPFSEANQVAIKANYFNKRRSQVFNSYFDRLKRDFKVNIVQPELIKTL